MKLSLSDPHPSEDVSNERLDVYADGLPRERRVRVTLMLGTGDDQSVAEYEMDPAHAIEVAMRIYRAATLALANWMPDFTDGGEG